MMGAALIFLRAVVHALEHVRSFRLNFGQVIRTVKRVNLVQCENVREKNLLMHRSFFLAEIYTNEPAQCNLTSEESETFSSQRL